MSISAIFDPEMIICEKGEPYPFTNFLERVVLLTDTHTLCVEKFNVRWLYSLLLFDYLWNYYPWNSPIHNHTDLFNLFTFWSQKVRLHPALETTHVDYFQIIPNIFSYADKDYPELISEWTAIIAEMIKSIDVTTIILSYEDKTNNTTIKPPEVSLYDYKENNSTIFKLIKTEADWIDIVANNDPWVKHQLPKTGDFRYKPAFALQTGDHDFPNENRELYEPRDSVGFKDDQGRLWVAHSERGKIHWDIQFLPYSRNNYIKVTTDGVLLADRRPK